MLRQSLPKRRWTTEEILYLRVQYESATSTSLLADALARTTAAVKLQAAKLGLRFRIDLLRRSNVEVLLEETPLSLYWVGFLLADGYFNKQIRIKLVLSMKDRNHAKDFALFIGTENVSYHREAICVGAQNINIVPQICNKFDIRRNKTIVPPNIANYSFTLEQHLWLFFGFFDGDGNISIRKPYNSLFGRIKIHSSWLSNLLFWYKLVTTVTKTTSKQVPKINSSGYAEWAIPQNILIKLVELADTAELPILGRKWDCVRYKKAQHGAGLLNR